MQNNQHQRSTGLADEAAVKPAIVLVDTAASPADDAKTMLRAHIALRRTVCRSSGYVGNI